MIQKMTEFVIATNADRFELIYPFRRRGANTLQPLVLNQRTKRPRKDS